MSNQNQDVIDMIADSLRKGMIHPGDRGKGTPPTPIALPFVSRAGQPEEMTKLMDATVNLLAEALTFLIQVDHEIVSKAEARSLRHAAGEMPESRVAVYCRCDTQRKDPLMVLAVTDPAAIVIDASTLIRGLSKREAAHPHKVVK